MGVCYSSWAGSSGGENLFAKPHEPQLFGARAPGAVYKSEATADPKPAAAEEQPLLSAWRVLQQEEAQHISK